MDLVRIEELVRIVKDAPVSEMTLRQDGNCVTIKKAAVAAGPSAAFRKASAKKEQPAAEEPTAFAITAPMVGIFHAATTPVQVGAIVKPGQIVGAIESMKLMNDVVAGVTGRVTEIGTDDGLPVEYGQTLLRLAPVEGD